MKLKSYLQINTFLNKTDELDQEQGNYFEFEFQSDPNSQLEVNPQA